MICDFSLQFPKLVRLSMDLSMRIYKFCFDYILLLSWREIPCKKHYIKSLNVEKQPSFLFVACYRYKFWKKNDLSTIVSCVCIFHFLYIYSFLFRSFIFLKMKDTTYINRFKPWNNVLRPVIAREPTIPKTCVQHSLIKKHLVFPSLVWRTDFASIRGSNDSRTESRNHRDSSYY